MILYSMIFTLLWFLINRMLIFHRNLSAQIKFSNRESNKYKTISASPGRATDQATEITSMEMRLLIGNHIRLHISEGSIRLMLYALIKCLNNILLKIRTARKSLNDRYHLPQNKQHACGFPDADILRRTFVRLVGITPAEYRKRFASIKVDK